MREGIYYIIYGTQVGAANNIALEGLDCEQSLIFLFKVTARETQARELR